MLRIFSIGTFMMIYLSITTTYGQLARKAQEVWPSIDAYYKLNDHLRLYSTMAGTKKDSSNYTDGSLGLFLDVFTFPVLSKRRETHLEELPGKYFRLRAGYQYSQSPPSSEDPFRENLFVLQADGRAVLPYSILFTLRNRFDFRFKEEAFSARYRPRLQFERDFHTEYLFFTITSFVEYYANFGSSELDRFRFQLAFEVKVTKHLSYETYWNHQFGNQPSVQEVDAFGMVLKFYLNRREKEKKGNKAD